MEIYESPTPPSEEWGTEVNLDLRQYFTSSAQYQQRTPPPSPKLLSISLHGLKPNRKARVLLLHGHAQSGSHMKLKTRFLISALEKSSRKFSKPAFDFTYPGGFEFIYADAPHHLKGAQEVGDKIDEDKSGSGNETRGWGVGDFASEEIQGYDESLLYLLRLIQKEGPFVGIVGFSTGCTLGLSLLGLAERGATPELSKFLKLDNTPLPPQPFKFGLFCSGPILSNSKYRDLFSPNIKTPVLHFIGKYDTFLPESETLKLSHSCENISTKYHQGSHFFPRYPDCLKLMVDFVQENWS